MRVSGVSEPIDYIVTRHCLTRLRERLGLSDDTQVLKYISRSLANAYVVLERPNKMSSLFKNQLRDAIYFYIPGDTTVIVAEKNSRTGYFNVLKTAYRGEESYWMQNWLNQTPKKDRVRWPDYIQEKIKERDVW